MAIKSDDAVRLMLGLIWPLVVLVLAIVFRRPLMAILEGATGLLRGGLSKVTLPGGIAFELAKTSEIKIDWTGPGGEDIRNTVAVAQFASGVSDILGLLKPPQPPQSADYAVFNLGSGHEWLTSRLHLFSLLLRRTHGLRYCVFVYEAPEQQGRFLGFATTEVVRWSLAQRYPHLERAAHESMLGLTDERITSHSGALNPLAATSFIQGYLDSIQIDLTLSTLDVVPDVDSVRNMARELREGPGLSAFLRAHLPAPALQELNANPQWAYQLSAVVNALKAIIETQSLYDKDRLVNIQLSETSKRLAEQQPDKDDRILLNRLLLRDAYPALRAPIVPSDFKSFYGGDWVKLETRDISGTVQTRWEHASWINRGSADRLLGTDLGRSQVPTSSLQTLSRKDQVSMILRAEGPMVAVVGDGGHFERLIDRLALAGRAIEFYL